MGAALWRGALADTAITALPAHLPPGERGCRYQITVFDRPRTPWRTTPAEAMADAISLELASWDESRKEHFLAVPVSMKVWKLVNERR
jgi:hypothetical protein